MNEMRIFWGRDVGKREKKWDETWGRPGEGSIEFNGFVWGGSWRRDFLAGTERHRAGGLVEFFFEGPLELFGGDYLYEFFRCHVYEDGFRLVFCVEKMGSKVGVKLGGILIDRATEM